MLLQNGILLSIGTSVACIRVKYLKVNVAMTIYIHTSYYSKFVLKTNPTRLNFLYNFLIEDKGVDKLQIQNSLNRHSALATITF